MKSRLSVAMLALALLVVGASVGQAQTVVGANVAQAPTHRSHFGPRVSYNFDAERMGLGVQFSTPVTSFLEFYPSFDTFMVSPASLWALNGDLKLRLAGENLKWLYFGGGLNITRAAQSGLDNTETGLNLFGGFETNTGSVHPFGEMRMSFADGSSLQLSLGLNFTLGSR